MLIPPFRPQTPFAGLWALLLWCSCSNLSAQNRFSNLATSTDSTLGYTAQNPLQLKKGNQSKSIDNTYLFLSGLMTIDNQNLTLLYRQSVQNPRYKEPALKINSRKTGLPISGNLGMLDKYVLLTSASKDTVTLYIDIYNKGNLSLPVGLKYQSPGK